MGLRGEGTLFYASPEAIAKITDVTADFHAVYVKLQEGDLEGAKELLPQERIYPAPKEASFPQGIEVDPLEELDE